MRSAADATLVIRADAGPGIGAGHVVRCIALACAWRDSGGEVVFACAELSDALRAAVETAGGTVAMIAGPRGSDADRDATAELAVASAASIVVLDGYCFDAPYQARLRRAGVRVAVVDDVAGSRRHDCELLVNQNAHARASDYLEHVPGSCRLLMGTRFALVRPAFRAARRVARVPRIARRLLVTLGGGDTTDATLLALDALAQFDEPRLDVTVMTGAGDRPALESRAARLVHPVTLTSSFVADPQTLFADADLVISAGGSTTWEVACTGVPAIVVCVADNQRPSSEALGAAGAVVYAGTADSLDSYVLGETIRNHALDAGRRRALADAASRLVDGLGASRVVSQLRELAGLPANVGVHA